MAYQNIYNQVVIMAMSNVYNWTEFTQYSHSFEFIYFIQHVLLVILVFFYSASYLTMVVPNQEALATLVAVHRYILFLSYFSNFTIFITLSHKIHLNALYSVKKRIELNYS